MIDFAGRFFGRHERESGQVSAGALAPALAAVPLGFAFFDAEDRLVLCNPVFR